ncbi:MAG: tRNA 2-thiouridine(34) synthase MnmA [Treponemataceae bacterium]
MLYEIQDMPQAGDTVIVGMSGGVDSTLTAMLLKNRGCKVIGVTMSIWDGAYNPIFENTKKTNLKLGCYSPLEIKNIEEVKKFCKEQNIEYHVIDVRQAYQQKVMNYFKEEYRNGHTPNPCIQCNGEIKFGALLSGIAEVGIKYDFFCTGHYAKVVRPKSAIFGSNERPYMIATAADIAKDQTYFIYRVSSSILEKVRFPLASIKKTEVKELAKNLNLDSANREESQDFIGEEYFDLIFSDKPGIPGDIVDLDGKVLGRHKGIEHYTIGQRRGLGVAAGEPVYVQSIDAKNNIIVLAPSESLNAQNLIADDFVWPGNIEIPQDSQIRALVKIRLASRPVLATIKRYTPEKEKANEYKGQPWIITFDTPQRAIAPGQSAVLYDVEEPVILGGGIIRSSF